MLALASARSYYSGSLRYAFRRDNLFWYHCSCLVNDKSILSSLSTTNFTNPGSCGSLRTLLLRLQPWLRLPFLVRTQQQSFHLFFARERRMSTGSIELNTDGDVVRFSSGKRPLEKNNDVPFSGKGEKKSKRVRMSKRAKRKELRFYRLLAKKKMNSPNPEVRIRYKLQKAKRKEAWLIEKLRKFDVPEASVEAYDPEMLTEEEKHYLIRTGEKKKMYVPVGRRGVFGGVVLNMHLHWKKHETVKVVCKPCKPGQIHDYAEELARLSKGIVVDIKPDNTIIFYRGKNYVQPEVMSPPDTLSKAKALEKYKYEQSLEHKSQFIEKLEKELEEYQEYVARCKERKEDAPRSTLHSLGLKSGVLVNIEVATALMKAYSDLGGGMSNCYKLFLETTSYRDVVSWTSIITAFAEYEPEESLFLFRQLLREDMDPDWYTYSIVIKACAGLANERHALAVHSHVVKAGFEVDMVLANSLIHAYARCGSIDLSKQVFDEMQCRDIISWNSILKAFALHGQAKEASVLFVQMNILPDSSTMVALLSACSHVGLVDEGIKIFDNMLVNYGILPQVDHYACMVDILGRAGRVSEAHDLISRMPMEPDSVIWSALLSSCRKHGETQLAMLAADKLKELEPGNSLSYVQMSNIYCSRGNHKEAGVTREEMKGSRVRKNPGLSWIEIGNKVHEFASGGNHHPFRESIYSKLDALIRELKKIGYLPETSLALHDLEEEHKEEQLSHHSEKLALVFAVMNEGSLYYNGSIIKIIKNIRICLDCHNFMKLASDHLQKEIIVRDSNRFHHFKNRICSCNDFW